MSEIKDEPTQEQLEVKQFNDTIEKLTTAHKNKMNEYRALPRSFADARNEVDNISSILQSIGVTSYHGNIEEIKNDIELKIKKLDEEHQKLISAKKAEFFDTMQKRIISGKGYIKKEEPFILDGKWSIYHEGIYEYGSTVIFFSDLNNMLNEEKIPFEKCWDDRYKCRGCCEKIWYTDYKLRKKDGGKFSEILKKLKYDRPNRCECGCKIE